jgi:hypothetical protein
MLLYLASDLLWASKIKGTADALGIPARPVRNAQMLTARLGEATQDAPVRALLVDLESGPVGLELIALAGHHTPALRIVAFGPHVATEAFEAAHASGAHEVMARGGLAANLPAILTRLGSTTPPAA